MSDKDFNPWWKHVNDYLDFHEREEFVRGAKGYRPNNRQESMMYLLVAGYTNQKFNIPKSLGKNSHDSRP